MREEDVCRRGGRDERGKRLRESVRRVFGEGGVVERDHLGDIGRGQCLSLASGGEEADKATLETGHQLIAGETQGDDDRPQGQRRNQIARPGELSFAMGLFPALGSGLLVFF